MSSSAGHVDCPPSEQGPPCVVLCSPPLRPSLEIHDASLPVLQDCRPVASLWWSRRCRCRTRTRRQRSSLERAFRPLHLRNRTTAQNDANGLMTEGAFRFA